MRLPWLLGLIVAAPLAAAEPVPQDPIPFYTVLAIPPQNPPSPADRPNELPNLDPRNLPSYNPSPMNNPPRSERRNGRKSDYDPSYLYLPERNPGTRQPPCPCLPLGSTWVDATYFLGKTMNDRIPALATVGGSGVEGTPGVSILQGNDRLDRSFRSGVRADIGHWFDRCQNWGIEGSFFYMESSQIAQSIASNGSPILARPFTAQPGNIASAFPLAVAGQTSGWLSVTSPLNFLGADVNARHTLYCEDRGRLDFVGGYRFFRMSEGLTIHSQSNGADFAQDLEDTFHAVNLFNGGQVGLTGEVRWERFYLAATGKAAIGINWYRFDISGSSRTLSNGTTTTTSTGFLARSTNIGSSSGTKFAVAPEANLTIGYQIADHWRTYLGYTFVYVNSVARPGSAIDTQIGASFPQRTDPSTDLWMHGINLGLEARY